MVEHLDSSEDSFDADQHDYAVHPPSTAYEVQVDEAIDHTLNEVYASPRTKQQDQAISFMLEVSTRDYLLQWTESFTVAEDAGYNHCLSIISEIPTEDRARRFEAVESLPMHTTSETLMDLESECRTAADNYHQARNQGLTAPSSKEPKPAPPKRYGCPGQQGSCPEHRNRVWRSFVTFFEHLRLNHLGEFETSGGRLECLECVKWNKPSEAARYPPYGRELAQHIWNDHMTSIPGRSSFRAAQ